MEYIDIYGNDRISLGKVQERPIDMGVGENRQIVHICVFNSKNEMLIQKRQKNKRDWANLWDYSAGGHSMAGETSGVAATRELFEELGISHDFSNERAFLTINFQYGYDDIFFLEKDIELSELVIQDSEVADVKWASLDEILEMIDKGQFINYYKTFIASLFDLHKKRGMIEA